jgi:hypothetical protein
VAGLTHLILLYLQTLMQAPVALCLPVGLLMGMASFLRPLRPPSAAVLLSAGLIPLSAAGMHSMTQHHHRAVLLGPVWASGHILLPALKICSAGLASQNEELPQGNITSSRRLGSSCLIFLEWRTAPKGGDLRGTSPLLVSLAGGGVFTLRYQAWGRQDGQSADVK